MPEPENRPTFHECKICNGTGWTYWPHGSGSMTFTPHARIGPPAPTKPPPKTKAPAEVPVSWWRRALLRVLNGRRVETSWGAVWTFSPKADAAAREAETRP